MKTKNQTEQTLLELAITKAANDDGISPSGSREAVSAGRKQGWSPFEVWLTRVKPSSPVGRSERAPI